MLCLSVNLCNLINIFKISLTHTFCTFITTGGVKDEPQISATTPAKIMKNTTKVDQDEIEWDEYAAILRGQTVE